MDADAAKQQICLKVSDVCHDAIRVGEAMVRTISGAHDQQDANIEFTFPALRPNEAKLVVDGREKALIQGDSGGEGMEPFFDPPQRGTINSAGASREAGQGETSRTSANGPALHSVDDIAKANVKARADKIKKIRKLAGFKDFGLALE